MPVLYPFHPDQVPCNRIWFDRKDKPGGRPGRWDSGRLDGHRQCASWSCLWTRRGKEGWEDAGLCQPDTSHRPGDENTPLMTFKLDHEYIQLTNYNEACTLGSLWEVTCWEGRPVYGRLIHIYICIVTLLLLSASHHYQVGNRLTWADLAMFCLVDPEKKNNTEVLQQHSTNIVSHSQRKSLFFTQFCDKFLLSWWPPVPAWTTWWSGWLRSLAHYHSVCFIWEHLDRCHKIYLQNFWPLKSQTLVI